MEMFMGQNKHSIGTILMLEKSVFILTCSTGCGLKIRLSSESMLLKTVVN